MKKFFLTALLVIMIVLLTNGQVQRQSESVKATFLNLNGQKIKLQPISVIQYKSLLKTAYQQKLKDTIITKHKGILRLHLLNGKVKLFKDIDGEVERKQFSVKCMLNNRFYILEAAYYENGEILLIDKANGAVTNFYNNPLPSPNGGRIVAFSASLAYDMMPNGIQLFSITGKPRLMWAYKIDNWEPRSVSWINDHTLIVCKSIPDFITKSHREEVEYLKISF